MSYHFRGMGDVPSSVLAAPPSNATVAAPSVSVLNVTQMADMTNGGNWRAGDSYRVVIANVGSNLPVTLNGAVVGNTGQAGYFQQDGTISASVQQNWSVPAGSYGSGAGLLNLAGVQKTLNISVGGVAPSGGLVLAPRGSYCFSIVNKFDTSNPDTSVCYGPATQATWVIAGLAAMGLFWAFGGKR